MADESFASRPESAEPGLDYDHITADIVGLDTEIRKDASRRLSDATGPVTRLEDYGRRLSGIVRMWTLQPDSVAAGSLEGAEKILLAIYRIFEDDLPRYPFYWTVYGASRHQVQTLYGQTMDTLSIFKRVLDVYGEQYDAARSPGQIAAGTQAMVARRRDLINAIREFQITVDAIVKELLVTSRRAGS